MEAGRPSETSTLAALIRAGHLLLDGEPKVLCDDLALALSGVEDEHALRATLEGLAAELIHRTDADFGDKVFDLYRAFALVRNRYAEDELQKAVAGGVDQYVILGAGLDSFAYRRPDLMEVLRVFEVDHPATQNWKRGRLQELAVQLPPNLTFVPIDFETQALADELDAAGYDRNKPGFFSWLGVTQYLGDDAIFGTLATVARGAPGTEIVFEYSLEDSLLDEIGQRLLALSRELSLAREEPLLSFFNPDGLSQRLRSVGFSDIEHFGPEEANARYFCGRADGLALHSPSPNRLIKAGVGDGD